MNFKNIIIAALAVLTFSCQSDDDNQNLSAQEFYDIEKRGIEDFLDLNYYDKNDPDDTFKLIGDTGKISLREDKTITLNVTNTEISVSGQVVDFKIYVIIPNEDNISTGISPDNNDKVHIEQTLLTLNEDLITFENGSSKPDESSSFIDLKDRNDALAVALPFFEGGLCVEDDPTKPRVCTGGDNGYIIVPFDAYLENLSSRQTLLYKINLRTVTKVANPK